MQRKLLLWYLSTPPMDDFSSRGEREASIFHFKVLTDGDSHCIAGFGGLVMDPEGGDIHLKLKIT